MLVDFKRPRSETHSHWERGHPLLPPKGNNNEGESIHGACLMAEKRWSTCTVLMSFYDIQQYNLLSMRYFITLYWVMYSVTNHTWPEKERYSNSPAGVFLVVFWGGLAVSLSQLLNCRFVPAAGTSTSAGLALGNISRPFSLQVALYPRSLIRHVRSCVNVITH